MKMGKRPSQVSPPLIHEYLRLISHSLKGYTPIQILFMDSRTWGIKGMYKINEGHTHFKIVEGLETLSWGEG